MTLVVDATIVVTSIASADGFKALGEKDLVAPALMWSETGGGEDSLEALLIAHWDLPPFAWT